MRRLHLMELEDQAWCPATLRACVTDSLQNTQHVLDAFAPAAPVLARALERAGTGRVVDLCSGGAGPWVRLQEHLGQLGVPVTVVLTDLYPDAGAFTRVAARSSGVLQGCPVPVDAKRVPPQLQGFRTLFNGFHHFRPEQARAVLQDAVDAGQGIGVFELTERTPGAVLAMLPLPLLYLLTCAFVPPFRWSRLFWSYVLPVAPLMALVDGVVSCLRTYSPTELQELASSLSAPGYTWETGQLDTRGPTRITYLVGHPPAAAARPVRVGAAG